MVVSDGAVRVARPTLQPGRPGGSPSLAEGLLSLPIVENIDGLYRCEATFGNWGTKDGSLGFLYFDRQHAGVRQGAQGDARPGRPLRRPDHRPGGPLPGVARPAPDGPGRGSVPGSAHDAPDPHLRRRQRRRRHPADRERPRPAARQSACAARPTRCSPRSTRATWRSCASAPVASTPSSGWRATRCTPPPHADRDAGTVALTHGGDLREFSVLADLAGQRTGVSVSGWDVAAKRG